MKLSFPLQIGLILFALAFQLSSSSASSTRDHVAHPTGNMSLITNWWDSRDRDASIYELPPYPGIFKNLTYRGNNRGPQDAFLENEVRIPMIRYTQASADAAAAIAPFEITLPAGTRLIRTSEGNGSSSSPKGRFLLLTFRLQPCPESYPREGGTLTQRPTTPQNALVFMAGQREQSRCELVVQIYSPRIRDEASREFVDSLELIPRGAPLPPPYDGSGSTQVRSESLSPREIGAPSPVTDSPAPSSSGAQSGH